MLITIILIIILLLQIYIIFNIKHKKVNIHIISDKDNLCEITEHNNDILISIIEPMKLNKNKGLNKDMNQLQNYSKQVNIDYTSKKEIYFYKNFNNQSNGKL